MEDFAGPVEDPEVNRKFRDAMNSLSSIAHPNAVKVYKCPSWPPRTIGVSEGKICMSPDLHAKATAEVPRYKPEDN